MASMLQKWYTRVIGVFFALVAVSLVADLSAKGYGAETWHKIFHVLLGVIVLRYGWNDRRWWRPFSLANGAFFTFVAAFGWAFPDFGGLDAFNRVDTILHTIVGLSGIIIGWKK
jgi:hypothetical protein